MLLINILRQFYTKQVIFNTLFIIDMCINDVYALLRVGTPPTIVWEKPNIKVSNPPTIPLKN